MIVAWNPLESKSEYICRLFGRSSAFDRNETHSFIEITSASQKLYEVGDLRSEDDLTVEVESARTKWLGEDVETKRIRIFEVLDPNGDQVFVLLFLRPTRRMFVSNHGQYLSLRMRCVLMFSLF